MIEKTLLIVGVLKKSQEAIIEGLSKPQKVIVEGSDHRTLLELVSFADTLLYHKHVHLEFVSFADSKPAVAKAANLLFAKHYASTKPEKPNFTESDISEALQAVGYGGPEPDLILVYGPVRCHMGFPAWRIRYTEIVHMGPLKSMKFGSLIKAIHKFTKVHQNYGMYDICIPVNANLPSPFQNQPCSFCLSPPEPHCLSFTEFEKGCVDGISYV